MAIESRLHLNDEEPARPLGPRRLLQRLTLIAVLIENFHPDIAAIPMLVRQAECIGKDTDVRDLQMELQESNRRVREEFGPLSFLYGLRTHGGLAHAPNKGRAADAAKELGLPKENWHRSDYLHLLKLITDCVYRITKHLEIAGQVIAGW